jgi:hypothetical protein
MIRIKNLETGLLNVYTKKEIDNKVETIESSF